MAWTSLDTWIVVTGALAAMACALPGCYLVLRRMSMMGDAISHAVLPGIVIAFLLTGTLDSFPMFLGAVIIGVLTALLTQFLTSAGDLETGASMGVVFTTLFAVGLILIRFVDHVDLDPDCVLYGAIELAPLEALMAPPGEFIIPGAVLANGTMFLVNAVIIVLLWKELKVSSFDPELATTLGINSSRMHYLLMCLTAATTVTAFHAVGSILVIAMLIVPAAAAFLLTTRLSLMIIISLVLAAASAVLGHLGAITIPPALGFAETSTSGMMAVAAGALFLGAVVLAPREGLLPRAARHGALSVRVAMDDVRAALWRSAERDETPDVRTPASLREELHQGRLRFALALTMLRQRRHVSTSSEGLTLTPRGRKAAAALIRSHRLWEGWMVKEMGLQPDHVHGTAERLEHITDREMRERLEREVAADRDPHNRIIPAEADTPPPRR